MQTLFGKQRSSLEWLFLSICQIDRLDQHHSSCLIAHFDVGGLSCKNVVSSSLIAETTGVPERLIPGGLYVGQLASVIIEDQRVAIANMKVVSRHRTHRRKNSWHLRTLLASPGSEAGLNPSDYP